MACIKDTLLQWLVYVSIQFVLCHNGGILAFNRLRMMGAGITSTSEDHAAESKVIKPSNLGRYGLGWNIKHKNLPIKWRKIDEEWSLHPRNMTAFEILEDEKQNSIQIRLVINKHHIKVYRDEVLIYEKSGNKTNFGFFTHAGFHVLVLHPEKGHLMQSRMFLTHQPAENHNLARCLEEILPDRLIIIAAVPDAIAFLGWGDAVQELERMGAYRIRQVALYEGWAMVAHSPSRHLQPMEHYYPAYKSHLPLSKVKRGRVWAEVITTRRQFEINYPSSIGSHVIVPKVPLPRCNWHSDPTMKEQKHFCDKYEGYARLCSCENPIRPLDFRYGAERIKIQEVIPVAMLTAIKPFNFYRQLLNLLETPGAAETPIVVMIDGPQREIAHLTRLFGLDLLIHPPQGAKGSSTLLNMHFRFSVHNVFNFFPAVDKAIILEDDLLLSPDFLKFFQQTAWLLDADPTIYCVNAFSVNSFPDVAYDPTILRRLELYPQFGWMITRKWAKEQYELWIPESETGDWDWWLTTQDVRRRRDALVPEISRTFHAGSAGAHVTGWAQASFYNHMIYNKDPMVKLRDLESLTSKNYEDKIRQDLLKAEIVALNGYPCDNSFLPKNKTGPFKIFMKSESSSDEYGGFYVLHQCLHANPEDAREQYRGVIRFNVHGQVLYIVGCPVSPFCSMFPDGIKVLWPSYEIVSSAEDISTFWQQRNFSPYYLERKRPDNPEQEFLMENSYHVYRNRTLKNVSQ